jgi:hypothetical protein
VASKTITGTSGRNLDEAAVGEYQKSLGLNDGGWTAQSDSIRKYVEGN